MQRLSKGETVRATVKNKYYQGTIIDHKYKNYELMYKVKNKWGEKVWIPAKDCKRVRIATNERKE